MIFRNHKNLMSLIYLFFPSPHFMYNRYFLEIDKKLFSFFLVYVYQKSSFCHVAWLKITIPFLKLSRFLDYFMLDNDNQYCQKITINKVFL